MAVTTAEITGYRDRYLELNGEPPPDPIIAVFVAVDEDRGKAEEMFERYVINYSHSAIDHYQFDDQGIAEIPGYEYYAGISSNIDKHGRDSFARFLGELQVWGTPDEVADKLIDYQKMVGAGGVIAACNYGGMSHDVAEQNMRTFAEKVMPRLQAYETAGGVGNSSRRTAVGATRVGHSRQLVTGRSITAQALRAAASPVARPPSGIAFAGTRRPRARSGRTGRAGAGTRPRSR